MKKILLSAALLAIIGTPAMAQNKADIPGECPAKTCTDHSHDHAYSPQNKNKVTRTWQASDRYTYTVKIKDNKKNCPAATCTDHSLDKAYSPEWNDAMQSMQPVQTASAGYRRPSVVRTNNQSDMRPITGTDYNLNNYTVYGTSTTGVNRPSAYEGDYSPTYDGPVANAYRNMRSNNDSEPLPANNGK